MTKLTRVLERLAALNLTMLDVGLMVRTLLRASVSTRAAVRVVAAVAVALLRGPSPASTRAVARTVARALAAEAYSGALA